MVKELGFVAIAGVAVIGVTLGSAFLGNAVKPDGAHFKFFFGENNSGPGQSPAAESATSKEWEWNGGDKITINVPGSVRVEEGSPARIIVRGDADTIARLTFANGSLSVRPMQTEMFRNISTSHNVEIILRGFHPNTFVVNGNDKINLGRIDQDQLDLRINGAGDVAAEGRADIVLVQISGNGKIYFGKLAAKTVSVDISGAGSAEVAPAVKLDTTIRGAGMVRLFSRPQDFETHISGNGEVIQAEGTAASPTESGGLPLGPPEPPPPPPPPR